MDGQGRVPSFEILTCDKGMAKSDTLSQGQTRGETDANDGQGLEAIPPHRHLEALDANGCAQASAKTSDGRTTVSLQIDSYYSANESQSLTPASGPVAAKKTAQGWHSLRKLSSPQD